MIRGVISLLAPVPLECQIVKSFLEAADYQVIEFLDVAAGRAGIPEEGFDAAVVILEVWDEDVLASCSGVRQLLSDPVLPIVAVATFVDGSDPNTCVLTRPIRLFELVELLDVARRRSGQEIERQYS